MKPGRITSPVIQKHGFMDFIAHYTNHLSHFLIPRLVPQHLSILLYDPGLELLHSEQIRRMDMSPSGSFWHISEAIDSRMKSLEHELEWYKTREAETKTSVAGPSTPKVTFDRGSSRWYADELAFSSQPNAVESSSFTMASAPAVSNADETPWSKEHSMQSSDSESDVYNENVRQCKRRTSPVRRHPVRKLELSECEGTNHVAGIEFARKSACEGATAVEDSSSMTAITGTHAHVEKGEGRAVQQMSSMAEGIVARTNDSVCTEIGAPVSSDCADCKQWLSSTKVPPAQSSPKVTYSKETFIM